MYVSTHACAARASSRSSACVAESGRRFERSSSAERCLPRCVRRRRRGSRPSSRDRRSRTARAASSTAPPIESRRAPAASTPRSPASLPQPSQSRAGRRCFATRAPPSCAGRPRTTRPAAPAVRPARRRCRRAGTAAAPLAQDVAETERLHAADRRGRSRAQRPLGRQLATVRLHGSSPLPCRPRGVTAPPGRFDAGIRLLGLSRRNCAPGRRQRPIERPPRSLRAAWPRPIWWRARSR